MLQSTDPEKLSNKEYSRENTRSSLGRGNEQFSRVNWLWVGMGTGGVRQQRRIEGRKLGEMAEIGKGLGVRQKLSAVGIHWNLQGCLWHWRIQSQTLPSSVSSQAFSTDALGYVASCHGSGQLTSLQIAHQFSWLQQVNPGKAWPQGLHARIVLAADISSHVCHCYIPHISSIV